MKPDKVTCRVYASKLKKHLADALPDVFDICSELEAIGNDFATESNINTDEKQSL